MRSGDEQSFRDYVAGRQVRLLRIAYRLCGDRHQAEDLVSTALVKLYRHWSRARRANNLDGYVYRIMVRVCIDESRRHWRRREVLPDALPDAADRSTRDPDDRMLVRELLLAMPPRTRAVLVLRYFEDLTLEQTAEALACSVGTVKSLQSRGLGTLRSLLAVEELT